jgi:Protein of unknown function (DUF2808)
MSFRINKAWRFLLPVCISTFTVGGILFAPSGNQSSSAMETRAVGASFEKAPRLGPISAINKGVRDSATYSFSIRVPEGAGAALQAVRVSQLNGVDPVSFETNQSRAYLGNQIAREQSIPLANIGGAEMGGSSEAGVLIPFATAIQPGQTVTVTLKVAQNPKVDGIYQFGVTAFPVGDNSNGLYLGTERVQYYYSR